MGIYIRLLKDAPHIGPTGFLKGQRVLVNESDAHKEVADGTAKYEHPEDEPKPKQPEAKK